MRLAPNTLGPALLLLLCSYGLPASADPSAGGDPQQPALQPIITRANVLLSSGHFGDAAKAYSEAIEQSPADYLLYYKRATAYLSLQRHSSALEDFDKVLTLTSGTFDNAHLQKARIYLKDGNLPQARHSLSAYLKAKKGVRDADAQELENDIMEADRLEHKMEKERRGGEWTTCVETGSQALKLASHSLELRAWRAECAFAAGDVASSVGDLTRLSNLVSSSTTLLTHIFRLSYFLLPPSPAPMNTLKQCLHYDPDSKPCLKSHRLVKALDKSFKKLDDLLTKEDWKGIIKLVVGPGGGKQGELWKKWEEAMKGGLKESEILPLVPPTLLHSEGGKDGKKKRKPMPELRFPLERAEKMSPQRQHIVRAACKSYTHMADVVKSSAEYRAQRSNWCSLLLTLDGCAEDVDGLVGKAESLLADDQERWEEAVRLLDKAFEAGGRSDRDVHGRLQQAQRKLKQSKQKDYYKILGVSRDADARAIKKAFRKSAKAAHPDKGGSEEKMAALNEAYEVLSNPELRERFDNGEDPMDPQAQQGGGGWGGGDPFAQFFAQQGQRRPFAGPGGFGQGGHGGGGFQSHGNGFHYRHGPAGGFGF